MKLIAIGGAGVLAVAALASAIPPAAPLEAAQFDFWVGEWDVHTADGKLAGASRVEKVSDGWGLLENWTGAAGGIGKSLNAWQADRKQWRQFWVGNGESLELTGGLNGSGEMVLSGTSHAATGGVLQERIVWTPRADGSVRQHWEQSPDGGATWTTAFDGIYRKRTGR